MKTFTNLIQLFKQKLKEFKPQLEFLTREYPENIIHFSAVPWINFTGLTHSRNFGVTDSCPKISYGKMVEENGKKSMALSVTAHHGLIDGYHIGLFIEALQTELNK